MRLAELKEMGGVVSGDLVQKDVSWTREVDGAEETVSFTVFVRKFSFGEIERLAKLGKDDRSQSAEYLSKSILLGDEGEEELTYEDAYKLDRGLAIVLMEAIAEVNGTGRKQGKKG